MQKAGSQAGSCFALPPHVGARGSQTGSHPLPFKRRLGMGAPALWWGRTTPGGGTDLLDSPAGNPGVCPRMVVERERVVGLPCLGLLPEPILWAGLSGVRAKKFAPWAVTIRPLVRCLCATGVRWGVGPVAGVVTTTGTRQRFSSEPLPRPRSSSEALVAGVAVKVEQIADPDSPNRRHDRAFAVGTGHRRHWASHRQRGLVT
jgi:hypothetical protein